MQFARGDHQPEAQRRTQQEFWISYMRRAVFERMLRGDYEKCVRRLLIRYPKLLPDLERQFWACSLVLMAVRCSTLPCVMKHLFRTPFLLVTLGHPCAPNPVPASFCNGLAAVGDYVFLGRRMGTSARPCTLYSAHQNFFNEHYWLRGKLQYYFFTPTWDTFVPYKIVHTEHNINDWVIKKAPWVDPTCVSCKWWYDRVQDQS